MPSLTLTAKSLKPWLERCGYSPDNIVAHLPVGCGRTVTLAGFSQRPFDSRSACLVATDVHTSPAEEAEACRGTGAPVTLLCLDNRLLWWRQGTDGSVEYRRVEASQLDSFFDAHWEDLSPQTIYRAKTLGRFEANHQRDFVDLGLMRIVEAEAGVQIERLLLDQVIILRQALGWPKEVSEEQGQWLVKSIFWLLGAKMLHDKSVEGFVRLDFGNVDQVLDRVGRHYGQPAAPIITSKRKRAALQAAATAIAATADLRLASTEALAYVYENTLISREVRKGLGTHSTPSYLIDYILGRLTPWISEMHKDQRIVFEPACGHAGFLVAAVRLLSSLLSPADASPANRKSYLRQRIKGLEIDPFAIEIARLSLTLTDIPNPNGWQLKEGDAFTSDTLEACAASSTILLANPPFEKIEAEQRNSYARQFRAPMFISKAAEILHRGVAALPGGGVFGLVVPQNLLHSKDASDFRSMLLKSCEFEEICLFPDKVFNFADVETAVLIGRKSRQLVKSSQMFRYRRVRDKDMSLFRTSYGATSECNVSTSVFVKGDASDLRLADLTDLWAACSHLRPLGEFVAIGQGFSFVGADQPSFPKGLVRTSPVPRKEFEEGFENLGKHVMTHEVPPTVFLNTDPRIIAAPRSGTITGIPQLLVNEARIQRAPWCAKAMIDKVGRRATTRFTIFRPHSGAISLTVLWALLNSPLANAHAFAHLSGWDLLTGTWRRLPVFDFDQADLAPLENAVSAYFTAVDRFDSEFSLTSDNGSSLREDLKILHWRIDAEVLKLYRFPVALERKLLDYFKGTERVGVPFVQDCYFPDGFEVELSLSDFLSITADWEATNHRRLALIEKKLAGQLVGEEKVHLSHLKRLANAKSALVMPLPTAELKRQENSLRAQGLWRGV